MSAPQTSTSPFRILVVDDEPALCELLAEVLKSPRRSVEVRDTAGGALDFVSRNPVDLAFLDVNLPGMSGWDLARHIKEISPHTRIVMCTGYHGEDIEAQARVVQADRVLHKPVDFGELITLTEKMSEGRS
ncbi:MAG: response regulator [Verrucomicrobiae bacterium]|nr:response regulator [Verrucomicrobiae bacterium]MDW8344727.1 response regulator [Verrucomicrobiae bacterium]